MRKGMGKGKGMGYKNLTGKDPKVHSMSAKGMKQPQKIGIFADLVNRGALIWVNGQNKIDPRKLTQPERDLLYRTQPKNVGVMISPKQKKQKPQTIKIEHGFDLTHFETPENFKKVLKENDLKMVAKKVRKDLGDGLGYNTFVWEGDGITLVTGNNPITGEFSSPESRKPEKGYASYIGIRGEPDKVKKLVDSIKANADYIKGEADSRDFI